MIAFIFRYLEIEIFQAHSIFNFVSPQLTQLVKSSAETAGIFLKHLNTTNDKIKLFPVNDNDNGAADGGLHWSLLVFNQHQGFFGFDSLGKLNLKPTMKLVEKLQ